VVGSRLRLKWSDVLEEILSQPELIADFLGPYLPQIERAKTPLQRMATHWCIENLVPQSQLIQNPHWIPLRYEECLADPYAAFTELFDKLELAPTPATRVHMKKLVSSPSKGAGKPHPWHHPLSESEGAQVLDICTQFGLDLYGRTNQPTNFSAPTHQAS
jgi:hypothetical protein